MPARSDRYPRTSVAIAYDPYTLFFTKMYLVCGGDAAQVRLEAATGSYSSYKGDSPNTCLNFVTKTTVLLQVVVPYVQLERQVVSVHRVAEKECVLGN